MQSTKMNFTYEGLGIARLMLQMYVEKFIQDNKNVQKYEVFSAYEYLEEATDQELEDVLKKFVHDENLDAITFKNWKSDCEKIFSYIKESNKYKDIELRIKKKGYTKTGCAVIDRSDNSIFECAFGQHWQKVEQILKEKYHDYYEAFQAIKYGDHSEYNGITSKELDEFIMERFELVGGVMEISYYL